MITAPAVRRPIQHPPRRDPGIGWGRVGALSLTLPCRPSAIRPLGANTSIAAPVCLRGSETSSDRWRRPTLLPPSVWPFHGQSVPDGLCCRPGGVASYKANASLARSVRPMPIDHEPSVPASGAEAPRAHEYSVQGISDGDKSRDALQETPSDFGLVVTDHSMPWTAGGDTERAMRLFRSETPVIATVGSGPQLHEHLRSDQSPCAMAPRPGSLPAVPRLPTAV